MSASSVPSNHNVIGSGQGWDDSETKYSDGLTNRESAGSRERKVLEKAQRRRFARPCHIDDGSGTSILDRVYELRKIIVSSRVVAPVLWHAAVSSRGNRKRYR
jgi:hypothetical protein